MAFKRLSMRKIHRALRPKPMSRCAMPPHASSWLTPKCLASSSTRTSDT